MQKMVILKMLIFFEITSVDISIEYLVQLYIYITL